MTDRILIPLDGSEMAEEVFDLLHAQLNRKDIEVVLVHAISFVVPSHGEIATEVPQLMETGKAYVQRVKERLEKDGTRAKAVVEHGDAASVILDQAEKERVSLIAMTTHGRSGISRWLFGSVAEKVLRASSIPLFLHRTVQFSEDQEPKRRAATRDPIKNILLPTDGSECSACIVPAVAEFARAIEARVTLLHVTEPDGDPASKERFDAIGEKLLERDIPVETKLEEGRPVERILEIAKTMPASLIAMGTHGRSGVSRMVFGSVTEKVLRSTPLPMLVVRADSKQFQA